MGSRRDELSCGVCGKKSDSTKALQQHKHDAHQAEKPSKKENSMTLIVSAVVVLLILGTAYAAYLSPSSAAPAARVTHIRGNVSAPATITEFSDFQCPYCARAEPVLEQLLADNNGTLRIIYRHFIVHPTSGKAAEASECAGEQGKFWEYHDLLFKNQAYQENADLKNYAVQLGLNATAFNSCLDSGFWIIAPSVMSGRVKADIDEGLSLGVQGTPTFFVNGKAIYGVSQSLAQTLQSEIDKALNMTPAGAA